MYRVQTTCKLRILIACCMLCGSVCNSPMINKYGKWKTVCAGLSPGSTRSIVRQYICFILPYLISWHQGGKMAESVDTVDYVNKVKMGLVADGWGLGWAGTLNATWHGRNSICSFTFNCSLMFIVACKCASSLAAPCPSLPGPQPCVSANLFHLSTVKRLYATDTSVCACVLTPFGVRACVCISLV